MPGEGKIYILGCNVKIMLLMRAVHDKNQIMKPKGWKWWKCRQPVAKATCTQVKKSQIACVIMQRQDNRMNELNTTLHPVGAKNDCLSQYVIKWLVVFLGTNRLWGAVVSSQNEDTVCGPVVDQLNGDLIHFLLKSCIPANVAELLNHCNVLIVNLGIWHMIYSIN